MRGRSWTEDELSILRQLAESGRSDVEIGRRLGRAAGSVCVKRHQLGLRSAVDPTLAYSMARINKQRRARLAARLQEGPWTRHPDAT